MRTLIVAIAAVLAALVVGGAAIAGQGGLDLASDDADEATEAVATEDTTEDGDLEEATEDTESEDEKDKADDAKPESDDADVTDTETPFGEIRSAEVHAAIEAGERPEPAWKNPAHPTGGPEGEQASAKQPATSGDESAQDDAVEAPANDGGGAADDKRADGEHRKDN